MRFNLLLTITAFLMLGTCVAQPKMKDGTISNQMQATTELVGHQQLHGAEDIAPKRILMIASNPSISAQTGWPIGCWAAELTHPFLEFSEAGYLIELASPKGGKIEFDALSVPDDPSRWSNDDIISRGFINTPELMALTETTRKLSTVDPAQYDAVFLVGGQAPMYTFKDNQELMDFVANFYETGKPTAIVCHATTILTDTKLTDGSLLVKGKKWTGFANSEEDIADQAAGVKIQPYRIEDNAMKLSGTHFTVKPAFTPYAIQDGNLITGQQQYSGGVAARLVIQALETK